MDDISRGQIDRMIELLDEIKTVESVKLAKILKDADIIPKLYQYAYVESMHQILSRYDSFEKFKESNPYNFSHEEYVLEKEPTYDAVKAFLEKAHNRQDEICDFADSTLPNNIVGRCQDDDHYENCEDNVELTEEQQEKFEEINENKGWLEAWDNFIDIINPDDQHLTLILDIGHDETKVMKDKGQYVCETCLEVIRENSDGGLSCDLEMVEDL